MLELNFEPFPTLSTPRLLLREIQDSDVAEVYFMRSDPGVLKYINRPPALTLEDARQWISMIADLKQKGDGINWGITLKEENKVIGNVCFWNIRKENYRAEIGYALHPAYHNKGFMHEVLQAALAYAFKEMKLHSVEAHVNPLNEASVRLLVKNKFVKEAHFKEDFYFEGKFLDSAIYSLLDRNV